MLAQVGLLHLTVGFASVETEPKHNAESIAEKYPNFLDLKSNMQNTIIYYENVMKKLLIHMLKDQK
jgi:hypothetical protein